MQMAARPMDGVNVAPGSWQDRQTDRLTYLVLSHPYESVHVPVPNRSCLGVLAPKQVYIDAVGIRRHSEDLNEENPTSPNIQRFNQRLVQNTW